MKKYTMEFVGTGLFVLSILGIVASGNPFAPIAIGVTLMTLIYIGAHVSGGHYNPAVTLGLLLRGKIGGVTAISYMIAQFLGAIIAHYIAQNIFNINVVPNISSDMTAVFVAELIFTFALVSAVFQTAVSKSASGNSYFGFAIGATVIAGASSVGGISGGFFNPAVLVGVGLLGNISTTAIVTILLAQTFAAFGASLFYRMTEK